jgi:serine/threonine-protein phosphatase 2A activator
MKNLLSDKYNADLAMELKSYYLDCFGSSKRIDYGTGHEINFVCIIYILMCTGFFDVSDAREIIHHIFFEYILLVRKIQIQYKLEPAGAHGVWGLDEYHFLPFLFGASELINNDNIVPESILDDNIIKEYADTYMYISCIQYIKTVKKGGPFQNHSPTLASICNVPNWKKVAQGLVKMYVDEFFKKWVIMQHFYFGSVIRFE